MSVTVESAPTTNSADFDPIFPDFFFCFGTLTVPNGLKCYWELVRDQTRNFLFAICCDLKSFDAVDWRVSSFFIISSNGFEA